MSTTAEPLKITSAEAINRAIVAAEALGAAHLTVVFRAAAAGRVAIFIVSPGGRIREAEIRRAARPVLAIIGDDPPNGRARGPTGFPQIRKTLRGAARIMIHGAGAEPGQYELAVQTAEQQGMVVLVETSATLAREWATLARQYAPVLLIQPRDGRHPIMPRELGEALQ
jgi:hypothetical protein